MGSAAIQGELWGHAPRDWAYLQEPLHKPMWLAMLDAVEVGPQTRFLDAGCGGGGASVLADERGAQVTGLDAAEPLISIARERLPNGNFRTGDIETMPFADATFDVVFAANAIQYAADRVAAAREMRRVCAPNGQLAACIFGTPDKVDFRVFFKAIRDTLPAPPPGDGLFGLSEPGKLENILMQGGWHVLANGEVNCPFAYADFEAFWRANTAAGPVQGALRSVSEDTLKANVLRAIEPFRRADGSLYFDNWFRYVTAKAR